MGLLVRTLLGLLTALCTLRPHRAFPRCVHTFSRLSLALQIRPLTLSLLNPFNLNYLLKALAPKTSHWVNVGTSMCEFGKTLFGPEKSPLKFNIAI